METVSYEDFAKLEFTIGEIKEVEIVPEADRLLRLTVDVGEETPRQIVSGIREFFEDPQWLVGKRCPFITNLAPRVIKGYESQGMILAAGEKEFFALLLPHQDIPVGTKVR